MKLSWHPQVYCRKIKNKWILLEKNKEYIRQLNDTGSLVWEIAKQGATIDEITSKIASLYQQPQEPVKNDVLEFVNKYLKEEFLIKTT